MIIMINGAFGSGKTTSANELQDLIPNSMIFDPEEIGYMLRKLIDKESLDGDECTDDFQDIELWRILTVKIAQEIKLKYNKHLIVPMTIHNELNFEYIYDGFKKIDTELYHFCLIASKKTLIERQTKRGDLAGGWQFQQIEKCLNSFKKSKYKEHIITDGLNTSDVSKRILDAIML